MEHDALYVVRGAGKSVRPALLTWVYRQLSGNEGRPPQTVLDCGLSLEFVHGYSLVHDDLPSMDNDDFRRGRPTLHRVVGEARAILAGDSLLTGAFEILSGLEGVLPERQVHLISLLSRAAGGAGMVAGQILDLRLKDEVAFALEKLEKNHDLKTGALFGAATAMGTVMAGAPREQVERALEWGVSLGRLFQIVDDLLDSASATSLRGDEGPNYVALLGVDQTRVRAERLREHLEEEARHMSWNFAETRQLLDFFVQRKF